MQSYEGVPIIMAYGHPVSGKSTAVNAAMAVIGQQENIGGESTLNSSFTNLRVKAIVRILMEPG